MPPRVGEEQPAAQVGFQPQLDQGRGERGERDRRGGGAGRVLVAPDPHLGEHPGGADRAGDQPGAPRARRHRRPAWRPVGAEPVPPAARTQADLLDPGLRQRPAVRRERDQARGPSRVRGPDQLAQQSVDRLGVTVGAGHPERDIPAADQDTHRKIPGRLVLQPPGHRLEVQRPRPEVGDRLPYVGREPGLVQVLPGRGGPVKPGDRPVLRVGAVQTGERVPDPGRGDPGQRADRADVLQRKPGTLAQGETGAGHGSPLKINAIGKLITRRGRGLGANVASAGHRPVWKPARSAEPESNQGWQLLNGVSL